eukprot:TRINITY_DN15994_c0_g1_i1.p1 TRINITY_DN15994_c0_g1~~TRINITY_DN15994_c0_g1_i1.p1  ORF type:complete len:308 (+),score=25.65 TRINITY_DN15994_c0_g1_i1:64-987(+)
MYEYDAIKWEWCVLVWAVLSSLLSIHYAKKVRELHKTVDNQEKLRLSERVGRVKAEKKMMHEVVGLGLNVTPIGVIRSAYADRNGTPRQPGLVRSATTELQISKTLNPACLLGLEDYSHVYVLFWFHLNTNAGKDMKTMKTVVAPPRGEGSRVGIFACRTPHRPNPLGLSLVPILKVNHTTNCVTVAALDCVDMTPLIDIKPYLPAVERPVDYKSPDWVQASYDDKRWTHHKIVFDEKSETKLAALTHRHCTNLKDLIKDTLSIDFRSARQKKLSNFDGSLRLQSLTVCYTIDGAVPSITITDIKEI